MDELLAPCDGDFAGGMDLSLDPAMEEIRRARQEALPGLSSGAWERSQPAPGWQLVESRTRDLLIRRSKDLQVALWHVEALLHVEGLPGLARGLQLLSGLVDRFWEVLHPGKEEMEARIQRFLWMDRHLAPALRSLPLVQGIAWEQWECCRGQPGGEGERTRQSLLKRISQVDHAGAPSGLSRSRTELGRLIVLLEQRFPDGEAPVPQALMQALDDWDSLLGRAAQNPLAAREGSPGPAVGSTPGGPAGRARQEVVAQLRESAAWFRDHEPHSPVAPLVARAARWADMPLADWLAEVLKDEGTLAQVRELLDLPPGSG